MKNFRKLLFTFALIVAGVANVHATKLYATYGTPASQGSWDSETASYSWKASYSNLMTIFEFPEGDLADYTAIHLTTADYTSQYRICFMNGSTAVATITFYSAGQKDLVLAERTETKDIDLSQITHIAFGGASGSGSVTLSKAYIEKPTAIEFDDTGVCTLGLTEISADANLTFDDQTGEMTSNGAGTFTVTLNNVDFSTVTKIELLRSGDDIVQTLEITDATNGVLNTWYSSKYSLNFTSYQANATQVTKMAWNCNTAGTMTITGIRITSDVIVGTVAGETVLKTLQYYNFADNTTAWCTWNVATSTDTYYGSGSSTASNYVDLTAYEELRIYRDDQTGFRAFFINADGTGTNTITNSSSCCTWNDEGKYFSIDLSQVEKYDGKIYLNTIKSSSYGTKNIVNNIVVYKTPATGSAQYLLSGAGALVASAKAILENASATSIDATGITKATALDTTNPNCLIIANEGMVTNAQNVIVDGTCANLVLTDKKPFAAPADFIATAASFEKTLSSAATMVLPFAASLPAGVTAYDLTGVDGANITAVSTDNITANQPVLLNGTGTVTFTGSGAVAATADGAVSNGLLYGVYATGYVPASSYVLQNGASGLGFYQVAAENTISVDAFRAYLTAASPARTLNIVYGVTTGINNVQAAVENSENVYTLSGMRVAQPAKGIYIKNGKKVVVK